MGMSCRVQDVRRLDLPFAVLQLAQRRHEGRNACPLGCGRRVLCERLLGPGRQLFGAGMLSHCPSQSLQNLTLTSTGRPHISHYLDLNMGNFWSR